MNAYLDVSFLNMTKSSNSQKFKTALSNNEHRTLNVEFLMSNIEHRIINIEHFLESNKRTR